ncbi:MAG: LacI family DNA-binding transcriptional regulator [Tepidisphaeraceae bacterium]
MRQFVSQRQIAQSLDLSVATISRSLQDHPDITPQTRDRVLKAAAKMGYRPSARRGSISPAKPITVVVLVANREGAAAGHLITGMMIEGLSSAAAAYEATPVVHYVPVGPQGGSLNLNQLPPAFQGRAVDGVVLLHQFAPEVVKSLSERWPCVTIAHHVSTSLADTVSSDHTGAMVQMVKHLSDLGHQQIGFIGRLPSTAVTQARFGAFVGAVHQANLAWNWDWRYDCAVNSESGDGAACAARHIAHWAAQGVTAWQCDSDGTAYRVLQQLIKLGIDVPNELSICGYDGLVEVWDVPQLTTVRVPFVELGRTAMHRIGARVQGVGQLPQHILVRGEWVSGMTSGPRSRS